MTIQHAVSVRNSELNALVTAAGANATIRFYTGTRLSPAAWVAGSPLATITYGSTAITDANGGSAGGVSAGVLTFGGFTQASSSFVAGTPTWIALVTSGSACIATADIGTGAGNVQFTGSIVNNQNITNTGLTWTAGNQ